MKIRILILLTLISVPQLFAQTISREKVYLRQTIEYLKKVNSVGTEWVKDPKRKLRKDMESLVLSYDTLKSNLTSALVVIGAQKEKAILKQILDHHQSDRAELPRALLRWKYDPKEPVATELLSQLDQIHDASVNVLTYLGDEASADDATSVLLAEDSIENTITPLTKELTDKLLKLGMQ